MALMFAAAGCTAGPRTLRWSIEFGDDALRMRARVVRASIRRGGCEGEELYRAEVRPSGPMAMQPPLLAPGRYGFEAAAYDGSCIRYAQACSDVEVPSVESVLLVLRSVAMELAACGPEQCRDGSCTGEVQADAGPDAGPDAAADAEADAAADAEADAAADAEADATADAEADAAADADGGPGCGDCGSNADRCEDGRCVCGMLGRPCEAARDGANVTCCDGSCVDTQTDGNHCGACGHGCGPRAGCMGGRCTCDPGFGDCDGSGKADDANGCEVDLLTSLDHCGRCGAACTRPGATSVCMAGTCRIDMCDPLRADCDGNDANGCETQLDSLTDCGACGTPCSRANATATCAGGTCRIAACNAGFGNCDDNDANGCENTLDSVTHCGSCGTPCSRPNATASCAGDRCQIASCNSGFGNCDGIDANGCENTLDSLTHCGGCGVRCSRPNATATCAGDVCRIAACNAGFGNCDGNDANGCENTLDSLTDCGTCRTPCSRAHATATCAGDVCRIAMCNPGYANCDGIDSNGCECIP